MTNLPGIAPFMFDQVFQLLVRQLNTYFDNTFSAKKLPPSGEGSFEAEKIVSLYSEGQQGDSIKFPINKVTPLLINIEEENQGRTPLRFSRVSEEGKREQVFPDIRLNLYILLVFRFQHYLDAMYYLGLVVRYVQSHPLMNKNNTADFPDEFEQLILELVTLPFAEQNEVWNALRAEYHPSLLFKVKMLVFQDEPALIQPGEIIETNRT